MVSWGYMTEALIPVSGFPLSRGMSNSYVVTRSRPYQMKTQLGQHVVLSLPCFAACHQLTRKPLVKPQPE